MATQKPLATSQLDLAARSIDLVASLQNFSTSSNSLVGIAWDIAGWLGREKLSKDELDNCLQRSSGLVIASENINAQAIVNEVREWKPDKPVGQIYFQMPASLGRLIAQDPEQSWMISTVACFFRSRQNDQFIARTLLKFILQSRVPDQLEVRSIARLESSPDGVRLLPVLKKLVSSIWVNVLNSERESPPLPSELEDDCTKGHYLDENNLALIIHAITFQCRTKAVLLVDHFLRDAILWLYYHFDGLLVIVVCGSVIFERQLGPSTRELEIRIKSKCSNRCSKIEREGWNLYTTVANKLEDFLSGSCSAITNEVPRPGVRRILYDCIGHNDENHKLNDDGYDLKIRCTAQLIMRELLDIPVQPYSFAKYPVFATYTEETEPALDLLQSGGFSFLATSLKEMHKFRLRDILYRTPSMLHMHWGKLKDEPPVILKLPERRHVSRSSDHEDNSTSYDQSTFINRTLMDAVPALNAVRRSIAPNCNCGSCKGKVSAQEFKPGCLVLSCIVQILVLVAHGIADAFGVSDASSIATPESIAESTARILTDALKQEGRIDWNDWFRLCATICLGCYDSDFIKNEKWDAQRRSIIAIQFGDLAIIAPWLDLNQVLSAQGCYRAITARGSITVRSQDRMSGGILFHGVTGNVAIVEAELSEDFSSSSSHSSERSHLESSPVLEFDRTYIDDDSILARQQDNLYRLMFRYRTSKHSRIINPCAAVAAIARQPNPYRCSHTASLRATSTDPRTLYTFTEILAKWPLQGNLPTNSPWAHTQTNDQRSRLPSITHIGPVLTNRMQYNLALALCSDNNLLVHRPGICCLPCVLEQAAARSDTGKYVISLDPVLEKGEFSRQLQLENKSSDDSDSE